MTGCVRCHSWCTICCTLFAVDLQSRSLLLVLCRRMQMPCLVLHLYSAITNKHRDRTSSVQHTIARGNTNSLPQEKALIASAYEHLLACPLPTNISSGGLAGERQVSLCAGVCVHWCPQVKWLQELWDEGCAIPGCVASIAPLSVFRTFAWCLYLISWRVMSNRQCP